MYTYLDIFLCLFGMAHPTNSHQHYNLGMGRNPISSPGFLSFWTKFSIFDFWPKLSIFRVCGTYRHRKLVLNIDNGLSFRQKTKFFSRTFIHRYYLPLEEKFKSNGPIGLLMYAPLASNCSCGTAKGGERILNKH